MLIKYFEMGKTMFTNYLLISNLTENTPRIAKSVNPNEPIKIEAELEQAVAMGGNNRSAIPMLKIASIPLYKNAMPTSSGFFCFKIKSKSTKKPNITPTSKIKVFKVDNDSRLQSDS